MSRRAVFNDFFLLMNSVLLPLFCLTSLVLFVVGERDPSSSLVVGDLGAAESNGKWYCGC